MTIKENKSANRIGSCFMDSGSVSACLLTGGGYVFKGLFCQPPAVNMSYVGGGVFPLCVNMGEK